MNKRENYLEANNVYQAHNANMKIKYDGLQCNDNVIASTYASSICILSFI